LLRDQQVVILGFGAIGALLRPSLEALGMRVVAFRRRPTGTEGVPIVSVEELGAALAMADHVISLLPESALTVGFMSRERFSAMKSGSVFYNIGRGKTVDQDALFAALKSGHLAAAWLDVTDPEPLPDGHPLLSLPNCFITPHTAGGHENEHEKLVRHFTDNFYRYLSHAALKDQVVLHNQG
jgi:phosphoglycerate dehydrogenase-like enzyme